MNFYRYLFFLLVAALVVSCEDKLEIEPEQDISGDLATTTESNIENVLIGTYDESGQGDGLGGSVQVISDLLGSGDQVTWGGTFLAPSEIKNKSILPDNGFVSGFWNNSYEVINQANIVIDNIDIVTSDPDKRDRIEGEARFLRALNYFELVRFFSSGNEGVPLRLTGILDYSGDLSIARAATSSVYDAILADLEAAIRLLPETNGFFADQFAAQALLARVQLYLKNYSAARDAANAVIENSGHALSGSFAAAFNHDSDNEEDLFAFQVTSQTGDNDLITYYASEGNGGRGGDITVNDEYVALFDDPNDERANFFYTSPENGLRLTSKFTNQFGNVPILRLAEMYLIRAQANQELGTDVGAAPVDDLNALRDRAGATLLTGPVTREDILRERELELAFEGFFLYDLKQSEGSVDGRPFDDPKLVLPIPISEMDTNPLMEQNPTY